MHSRPFPILIQLAFFSTLLLAVSVRAQSISHAAPLISSAQPTKAQVLDRLKLMQTHETEEIQKLEDAIKKHLAETTSFTLKEEAGIDSRKITLLADQIAELDKKRSERIARRGFLDQMILIVDSKYSNQPLAKFLEGQLLDMASSDLTNPQGSSQPWRFYTYLSIAVREATEPHEDVMNVVESYLNYATVLAPKTPAEFLESRNYTNPDASYTAHKTDKAMVGDSVEKQTRAKKGAHPADIELRMSASPKP